MLAEGGQRVAVIEKNFVGGSCTNVGCTPTKAHIAAAKVAYIARTAKDFGINVHLESIDLKAVVKRTRCVVEEFRRENEEHLLKTRGLELIYGSAHFQAHDRIEVKLDSGSSLSLKANTFIVAVGTRTQIPAIQGLNSMPFMTHVEALQIEEIPPHLLIMGGGYIACEFAQMFARFGSRVTIIQSGDQLLPHEDEDIAAAIADVLRDSGIEIFLNDEVQAVEKTKRGITATSGEQTKTFSHLLVATGRTPQTYDLGLERVGVELDVDGYIQTDEHMKTTNPSIYALGDCKGGPQFTHIAYDDARILRDGLLHNQWRSIKDRLVPYTVFLDPQLGRIGMSEAEARASGKQFEVARLQMKETARGIETGQIQGFWKILVEQGTDQILGGAFLSGEGGETMTVVQAAMMAGMPYTTLRDAIFAHPTWAESLNNVFLRFDEQKADGKQ
ncbi:putative pyridine nucleotide-disulfide oxidoreductase RclA [Abditibacteriota bacterium]|nr:putative pyridine nucleotide-disulfide oxidoreductase RclA [Abditibacteriota bacterium]